MMLALGAVQTLDAGPFGHRDWVKAELGTGYRFGHHLALGVTGAGCYIGRTTVNYLPPSGDFVSTTETLYMTPVTAYARLRVPVGRRAEPFVGAGAGGYTFWMHPDHRTGPRHVETRFGYHAEAGFTLPMPRFSPRFELRYDARSTAADEVGILPRGWFRMVTVAVGVQMP
jgi:opacity protein-like surface antigen